MATLTADQRLDGLSDGELLDELAELYSGVLSRIHRYGVEGLDPDYLDRPPDAGKLAAGLVFAAISESVTDQFLSGQQSSEILLTGWYVGLVHLRNELAWNAQLVAQGEDPRTRDKWGRTVPGGEEA